MIRKVNNRRNFILGAIWNVGEVLRDSKARRDILLYFIIYDYMRELWSKSHGLVVHSKYILEVC
jgi:hypothetical protein